MDFLIKLSFNDIMIEVTGKSRHITYEHRLLVALPRFKWAVSIRGNMQRFVENEKCVDIEEFRNGIWVVISCNINLGISIQKWDKYSKYGITEKDYKDLFDLQNGKCAICGKTSTRKLVVDHNHESMAIRGLLCNSCNVGIGFLKDDPEITKKATDYLLNY